MLYKISVCFPIQLLLKAEFFPCIFEAWIFIVTQMCKCTRKRCVFWLLTVHLVDNFINCLLREITNSDTWKSTAFFLSFLMFHNLIHYCFQECPPPQWIQRGPLASRGKKMYCFLSWIHGMWIISVQAFSTLEELFALSYFQSYHVVLTP